ncbi:MAG: hypothetical protein K2J65_09290 [Duncaniella sp.]|nr:hypothetical protein [Duncaniella sp.]MDE6117143.1 hypothetical protein [Duncaniella sp.]MDE6860588.1 hypothetical protein [Duncaniella sp.]
MIRQGSKWSTAILVGILFVSFMLLALGLAIYSNSLTTWWIPVLPAAMVSLGTAPMLCRKWRRLTDVKNWIVNLICHVFVVGSITYSAFLCINYWGADEASDVTENTEVVNKYRQAHTRYRRVGRNRRVADGEYYSYHLLLKFSDGREKAVEVPFSSYRNVKVGGHRILHVQDGLLGIRVIKK